MGKASISVLKGSARRSFLWLKGGNSTTDSKKAVIAVLILVLLFAVVYAVYANIPKPGAYLEGVVKIRYEDGSEIVIGSEDRDLFRLLDYWGKQFSVVTYQNKKLWGISTDISLRFTIDPPDKALNAQFWVLYWVELNGPFYQGTRGYSSLTGFVDIPLNQYEALRGFNIPPSPREFHNIQVEKHATKKENEKSLSYEEV